MKTLLRPGLATASLAAFRRRCPEAALRGGRQAPGGGELRLQPCHGSISEWKARTCCRTSTSTWSRSTSTPARGPGAHQRAQPAHRREPGPEGAGAPGEGLRGLPRPQPAAEQRGERFKASDGVSCEACHGPAEKWIASHVAPGGDPRGERGQRLYPTSDPVALARLCLSCHFGNKDKFVTHRIMGAGHPRISFELEPSLQTQPAALRRSTRTGRGARAGGTACACGPSARRSRHMESLDVVLDRSAAPTTGCFRSSSSSDCHCLPPPDVGDALEAAVGTRPGTIGFNDSNLLMLRQIVRARPPRRRPRSMRRCSSCTTRWGRGGATRWRRPRACAAEWTASSRSSGTAEFDDRTMTRHPRGT